MKNRSVRSVKTKTPITNNGCSEFVELFNLAESLRTETPGEIMPIEVKESCMVVTGAAIPLYRLMTLLSALKLEAKGLRMSRGMSVQKIIKQEFGLTGTAKTLVPQFEKIVENAKANYRNNSPEPPTGTVSDAGQKIHGFVKEQGDLDDVPFGC